jgi:hypothetical protein
MKFAISILIACPAILAATVAWAQAKPTKVSFDGKYTAQSIQCFPNNGQNRFNGLTIKDNKFSLRFTLAGQTRNCSLAIGADGSFDNQSCDVPASGKVTGDSMTLNYKNDDRMCKVALKRE